MTSETVHLKLTPRDPLIARDGRPFGAGLRMKSLDWIYPSVLAGSLRTLLGQRAGGFPTRDSADYEALVKQLKALSIAGPFFCDADELFLPCPLDVEVCRNEEGCLENYAIRPVDLRRVYPGAGCDLPFGLQPAMLAPEAPDGFKPERRPAFMRTDLLVSWLLDAPGRSFAGTGGARDWPEGFLKTPEKDVRTHVRMDNHAGAGRTEGGLFRSVGLDLNDCSPTLHAPARRHVKSLPLAVRVTGQDASSLRDLDLLSPLGGERRLVHWEAVQVGSTYWECPGRIRKWLESNDCADRTRIRMVLATPAIFGDGWKPDWLTARRDADGHTEIVGRIPGTDVTVQLVGACVDRWRPISGWGYENGKVGAKPIRRLVPAGSVYFLRAVEPCQVLPLADRWLESVCQNDQDQRDGFGLALWGTWDEHSE